MATRVQEGFKIIAQLDGTTLNGRLRVENTALIQSYSDSGTYIPNFETLSDDMKPAVVPVILQRRGADVRQHDQSVYQFRHGGDIQAG